MDSDESNNTPENNSENDEASTEVSEDNSENKSDNSETDTDSSDDELTDNIQDSASEDNELSEKEIDSSDSTFTEVDPSLIDNSLIISESTDILDKFKSLDSEISQDETQAAKSSSEKYAFFYLNTRNLSWDNIDYTQCYYVGKGSVSGNMGAKGQVKTSCLKNVPKYDGGAGRLDISWDYFDTYDGYYRIYGTITPHSNIKEEKTAYYYLNVRKLKYSDIDYRKCYYVGRGSVIEENDYRGIAQNVTTKVIPEYNNQIGRYNISWDHFIISNNTYNVYGTVTPASDLVTEKMALFFLNVRGLDLDTVDYKNCYYIGKGSVVDTENYLGEITDIRLTKIPEYDGSLGPYNISWDRKELTDQNYYRIYATVIPKKFSFNSVAALQQTNFLEVGDVVNTKGFYSPNDGGGAEYTITDKNPYGNDMRAIKLANDLFAVLTINNNTIIANQFGAYGDGTHDDIKAIQSIINLGYNVELNNGQSYKFISNGLYLSNPVSINGNGATILVDGSYNPPEDCKYYLIRNQYGNRLKYIDIRNLHIRVLFPNNRISGREFVVISPLQIDSVNLQNIDILTSKTNNCMVCVWVDNGCNYLKIHQCKFINQTTGVTGGSLWLTSKDATQYASADLRNCEISNTTISSSAGDEVLGIWGTHNINATFKNSTIEGKLSASAKTRVISIISMGKNKSNKKVTFSNCLIKASCDNESADSFYDSVFGIGADDLSDSLNVVLNNSQIISSIHGAIIFPCSFKPENISQYDGKKRSVAISFNNCDIDCASTITGTYPIYYDTSVGYPTYAWDCQFKSCNIKCLTAFAFLYVSDNAKYYIPEIKIIDCYIDINDADAFICQSEKSTGIDLEISNTEINAVGVDGIISSRLSRVRTLTTQKNAYSNLKVSNVSINKIIQ